VASVLAYSVLSAGIFSSEKGKAAVYKGLDQASASMEIRGSVLGTVAAGKLSHVQFNVASVLQDDAVDMTPPGGAAPYANSVVINYTDSTGLAVNDVKTWTATIKGQERGVATMLEANEQMLVDVTVPTNTLAAYGTFTLQVIPPKGAAITISRTLPGSLTGIMDLH